MKLTKAQFTWRIAVPLALIVAAFALLLRYDVAQVRWAETLSAQGSPPPARELYSPTGYSLGQRHFLGTRERGETYRWIATTQEFIATGFFGPRDYTWDTSPEGRPLLLPRLYAQYIAALASARHLLSGEPMPIAVEKAALWEPVLSHVVAFLCLVGLMWTRFGPSSAGLAGLFFASSPLIAAQFTSGALTARTGALLFAAYVLALNVPRRGKGEETAWPYLRSSLSAGVSLWLDPAFGFTAILISACAQLLESIRSDQKRPFITWSVVGSALAGAGWIIDGAVWNPSAGELRYNHPLYAAAWLGIGLIAAGIQNARGANRRRAVAVAQCLAGLTLVGPLVYYQIKLHDPGWLYSGAALRRLTSLDETLVFNHLAEWFAAASAAEICIIVLPLDAVIVASVFYLLKKDDDTSRSRFGAATVVFAAIVLCSFFRVRWLVVGSLLAPVLYGYFLARHQKRLNRVAGVAGVIVIAIIALCGQRLPLSLERPNETSEAQRADLEAMIYRHCAHWLATHTVGQPATALASPSLSDSLIFHGGCHTLVSTAWESYPGQVAASRILSAPEFTEAEAVLESRKITHVLIPSWDQALPLFVQNKSADNFYTRLQRWVLPAYLRAIPYHPPQTVGYVDQKLPVFKMTAPQDEALALSRLAEYFAEMNRPEPAQLAARAAQQTFPDDPNVTLACATVYGQTGETSAFENALSKLSADTQAGRVPPDWDRRVQRAIVFALGKRHDLAKPEVEACLENLNETSIPDLTPLQAHRLARLVKGYGLRFPDEHLASLLGNLSAEYEAASYSAR